MFFITNKQIIKAFFNVQMLNQITRRCIYLKRLKSNELYTNVFISLNCSEIIDLMQWSCWFLALNERVKECWAFAYKSDVFNAACSEHFLHLSIGRNQKLKGGAARLLPQPYYSERVQRWSWAPAGKHNLTSISVRQHTLALSAARDRRPNSKCLA